MGLKIDYLAPTVYLTDILVLGILGSWGVENIPNLKSQISNLLGLAPRSGAGKATPKKFLTKLTGQATKNLKLLIFPISVFLLLLVNALLAQNSNAALYKFVKIIEFTLLGLYVARDKNASFTIRNSLFIPVIYSSLIALVQFFKQASLNGLFWWLGERTFDVATPGIAKAIVDGRLIMRPYAIFPHPNVLAGFILISLILSFPISRTLKWLGLISGAIAIAVSFSRSVWLVGAIVLLVSLWWRVRSKEALYVLYSMFFILCSMFLFSKLPFSTEEAIDQRIRLAQAAVAMIKKSPVIGVGLNNFIFRLPDFWLVPETVRWLQPVHNIFLLTAAETGLVGLVIFLWLLFLTYRKLLVTNNQLLITALTAILLLGLLDHYWLTIQQTQLLLSLVLGLAWGYNE